MNESFEEKFRAGLNRYIEIERKKPTAIADAAGIPRPTFSKIRQGKQRIYGDQLYAIACAEKLTPEQIAEYANS
jgi:predicted transcriptional regulator